MKKLLGLLYMFGIILGQDFARPFSQIRLVDLPHVGGKNASLGEMLNQLQDQGIRVPTGFALTTEAYHLFITENNLNEAIHSALDGLNPDDLTQLAIAGRHIRTLIVAAHMPLAICQELLRSYAELSSFYGMREVDVAVRSSATAEDLPDASFAGQQDTYLNIKGVEALIQACKECYASLFNDRAIAYRVRQGFDHFDIALSIGVQKMVRSDKGCAGVAFSIDPESGFKDVVSIEAVYGLGEQLVQGHVNPDAYRVFKPTLVVGYASIISKHVGTKHQKMVYGDQGVAIEPVPSDVAAQFCLSEAEILELAQMVIKIENHYSALRGIWTPMDIEWAKDGLDGKLYVVQARPETVHSQHKQDAIYKVYELNVDPSSCTLVCKGQSIGKQIVSGRARIIQNLADIAAFQEGEILVTSMTDPDWVPVMKKAAGIVTDLGGRTCHAAIVSRELGVSAIVGSGHGSELIKNGQMITLDCSQGSDGYIYEGQVPFTVKSIDCSKLTLPSTQLLVNIADPARAFQVAGIPFVKGVGLARLEFIIANIIKAHPMAFVHPERLSIPLQKELDHLTAAYPSKEQFFVDKLAEGIATIAAAFFPRRVIVRFSDFKSNEYYNLIGGSVFEPTESNPMLGLRGASRYYNEMYAEAFLLEVQAIRKVREQMGLTNVSVMIPFIRTLGEADQVIAILEQGGLIQGQNDLDYFMMVEVPSSVILLDEYAKRFNGFSIGSNDLTQFVLAVDRDSAYLTQQFNEQDLALQRFLKLAVQKARANDRYIGICGQAPSDYPEIGSMLLDEGISSLSLNPDAVLPFVLRLNGLE